MAVRIDNSADYMIRSTGMPTVEPFTMCAWVYLVNDRATNCFFFLVSNASGTVVQVLRINSSRQLIVNTNLAASSAGSTLALNTWYHIAYTRNGTSHIGYLNGVSNVTLTSSISLTPSFIVLGSNSSTGWTDGRFSNIKIWSGVVLSAAEIVQEMYTVVPVRTANLHLYSPVLKGDRTTDYSGNARSWTEAGSLTDEDEAPVTWRASPYSGVPIIVSTGGQNIGVDASAATGLGYQLSTSVGNVDKSVNQGLATGLGYNVTSVPGVINSSVNNASSSGIGYAVTANQVQTINQALATALGYDVGYSVGAITQSVNTTDASALGYEVNTVTGAITPIELSSATGLGYDVSFSTVVSSNVNKSDASGIGYNVGNTLLQSVNNAVSSGLGHAVSTELIQAVASAVSSAIGYQLDAFTTGQTIGVNQALATGLGYQSNFTVGAIIITVNLANASGVGKNVVNGEFVIVLSPTRVYVVDSENRVYTVETDDRTYEPFENRIFIARD